MLMLKNRRYNNEKIIPNWRIYAMKNIGKAQNGKLYHILNRMTGGEYFSLCGCYMPEDKRVENMDAFDLDKKKMMCQKCMHSAYFKQDID